MKQNTMLMIGGAIVVYLLWKKSQETTETVIVEGEPMSSASGKKKICYHTQADGTIITVPCPWDRKNKR